MTLQNWKAFFAGVISLSLLLTITSCGQKLIPQWNGKIYSVDVERGSFVRAQDNEEVFIEDLQGAWLAMSLEDFESFVATYVGQCQKYPRSSGLILWSDEMDKHQAEISR